jgi:hypothetical protein
MWHLSFWVLLILLNIMMSSSIIHFPANSVILFFFVAE